MAITVDQQPSASFPVPAWNKVEYLFDSTNYAQTGFKLVMKINDASGPTQIAQLDLYVVPGTTDKLYVDIAQILRSYVLDTYSIPANGEQADILTQTQFNMTATVQEYYSGALQGSATTLNDLWVMRQAFPLNIWANSNQWRDWVLNVNSSANEQNHLLNGWDNEIDNNGTSNPVISAANKFVRMKSGQNQQIRFRRDTRGGNNTFRVYVALYDEAYAVTQSDYISFASTEQTFYGFDIGTDILSSHTWVGGGITPTSSDKYLAVWVYDASQGFGISAAKLFEIDWTSCAGYTPYEVHWLNRYGGFDVWTFTRGSTSETMLRQASYKSDAPVINVSGNSITNEISARTVRPFYTKLKDTYELNSDNLLEWEYEGMRDLLSSPEVYIVIGGQFYSATVKDNSTIRNKRAQDFEVITMTVKLEVDTNEERQW